MEANLKSNRFISWLKNNFIFILLFALIILFINYKLSSFESIVSDSVILPNANLDFQNKSGVARIKSSFTDLLIASEGSNKKGDGYEVKLKILNPSSARLHSITCEFRYNSLKSPVTYKDINMELFPGTSKVITCFISDLTDNELKSINVFVQFDQIAVIRQ